MLFRKVERNRVVQSSERGGQQKKKKGEKKWKKRENLEISEI